MADQEKRMQISRSLWLKIVALVYYNDESAREEVRAAIDERLKAERLRDLYTQMHNAATPEAQEKARQEYLEIKGIPDDFRWSQDYENKRRKKEV